MRKLYIAAAISFWSSAAMACPIPSDEQLVCEVVLCNPIGLTISESRSECLAVNRRFAIYLATLGPFRDPPRCKMRDQQCRITGRASNALVDARFCHELDTSAARNSCLAAIGQATQEYCDTFSGDAKDACEAKIPPRR